MEKGLLSSFELGLVKAPSLAISTKQTSEAWNMCLTYPTLPFLVVLGQVASRGLGYGTREFEMRRKPKTATHTLYEELKWVRKVARKNQRNPTKSLLLNVEKNQKKNHERTKHKERRKQRNTHTQEIDGVSVTKERVTTKCT